MGLMALTCMFSRGVEAPLIKGLIPLVAAVIATVQVAVMGSTVTNEMSTCSVPGTVPGSFRVHFLVESPEWFYEAV